MGKFVPVESRVVIRHLDEKITEGGLVLPITTKTLLTEAVIVSVGPGKVNSTGVRLPMIADSSKLGGKVLVRTQSGLDLGDNLRLIEDAEILGLIE
jgi:chaperonin GroES